MIIDYTRVVDDFDTSKGKYHVSIELTAKEPLAPYHVKINGNREAFYATLAECYAFCDGAKWKRGVQYAKRR